MWGIILLHESGDLMSRLWCFLLVIVLIISGCTSEDEQTFTQLSQEGEVCLPYSPNGLVVYESEWTGEYPEIEKYDKPYDTITFGMGCFWGPAAEYAVVDGVLRTRVGYASGTTGTPSYDNLGDYVEVLEVDYNPEVISYGDLVELYFEYYDATARPISLRVKPIIYYRNESEMTIATKIKKQQEAASDKGLFVVIQALDTFYLAEPKHQLSYLKQEISLFEELRMIYETDEALLLSTLTSKLNGLIIGYGDEETLEKVLSQSSLSEASQNRMRDIYNQR